MADDPKWAITHLIKGRLSTLRSYCGRCPGPMGEFPTAGPLLLGRPAQNISLVGLHLYPSQIYLWSWTPLADNPSFLTFVLAEHHCVGRTRAVWEVFVGFCCVFVTALLGSPHKGSPHKGSPNKDVTGALSWASGRSPTPLSWWHSGLFALEDAPLLPDLLWLADYCSRIWALWWDHVKVH